MNGKIILEGSKRVLGWLTDKWDAIIATKQVKKKQQLDNIGKAVDVAVKITKAKRDMIDWKKQSYQELGLNRSAIGHREAGKGWGDTKNIGATCDW